LKSALGDKDPDIRWATAALLSRLLKDDPTVAAALDALARTGDPTQRRMALYCLREGARLPASALLASLQDPDAPVRVAALTGLGTSMEDPGKSLAVALDLLQTDPDSRVRCAAATTLAKIADPKNLQIRDALRVATGAMDSQVQKAARAALILLGKKGPSPEN
jgi:HEAT repeat protein